MNSASHIIFLFFAFALSVVGLCLKLMQKDVNRSIMGMQTIKNISSTKNNRENKSNKKTSKSID